MPAQANVGWFAWILKQKRQLISLRYLQTNSSINSICVEIILHLNNLLAVYFLIVQNLSFLLSHQSSNFDIDRYTQD